MGFKRSALLCVVSGPSGCGKTTLCRAASESTGCYYTVSCTTRAPRPGEVHGKDYYFLTEEDFHQRVAAGEFLEWASVYGRSYGTLRSEVAPHLAAGRDVVMDLDPQGAATIRQLKDADLKLAHVDIFIMPASLEEQRARLAGRLSDSAEAQARRLACALEEIKRWSEYDYTLVSGTREHDLSEFLGILEAERQQSRRLQPPSGHPAELGKISAPV